MSNLKNDPYGNIQAAIAFVIVVAALIAFQWPIAAGWLGLGAFITMIVWVFSGQVDLFFFTVTPLNKVFTGSSIIIMIAAGIFWLIVAGYLDFVLLPLLESLGF